MRDYNRGGNAKSSSEVLNELRFIFKADQSIRQLLNPETAEATMQELLPSVEQQERETVQPHFQKLLASTLQLVARCTAAAQTGSITFEQPDGLDQATDEYTKDVLRQGDNVWVADLGPLRVVLSRSIRPDTKEDHIALACCRDERSAFVVTAGGSGDKNDQCGWSLRATTIEERDGGNYTQVGLDTESTTMVVSGQQIIRRRLMLPATDILPGGLVRTATVGTDIPYPTESGKPWGCNSTATLLKGLDEQCQAAIKQIPLPPRDTYTL